LPRIPSRSNKRTALTESKRTALAESKRTALAEPASAARFRVDWGGPSGSEGFLRVSFLPFPAEGGGELQLTRAVDGRRDLLDWLQTQKTERRGIGGGLERPIGGLRPRLVRTVQVCLMDAGGEPAVTYRFEGASPVSLALSELDAVAGGLVTETLTVRFKRVSMA
jgi:hypothetical protein